MGCGLVFLATADVGWTWTADRRLHAPAPKDDQARRQHRAADYLIVRAQPQGPIGSSWIAFLPDSRTRADSTKPHDRREVEGNEGYDLPLFRSTALSAVQTCKTDATDKRNRARRKVRNLR